MVFSFTATTRPGASPASLTAAAHAARHTAAALFSAAARISKTTTSTSAPPSSTEKAATQPGRTSGHASDDQVLEAAADIQPRRLALHFARFE
eukprot:scaffold35272_cov64-Phaeocystis_antarctica.AAC.2